MSWVVTLKVDPIHWGLDWPIGRSDDPVNFRSNLQIGWLGYGLRNSYVLLHAGVANYVLICMSMA